MRRVDTVRVGPRDTDLQTSAATSSTKCAKLPCSLADRFNVKPLLRLLSHTSQPLKMVIAQRAAERRRASDTSTGDAAFPGAQTAPNSAASSSVSVAVGKVTRGIERGHRARSFSAHKRMWDSDGRRIRNALGEGIAAVDGPHGM